MRTLQHRFVEFIPDSLEQGILYISIEYCTAVHKCACGCGNEVVTPLSPADWEIAFNGKTISLNPSIGNWSFPCRSHYWVKDGYIIWAPRWTQKEIDEGRERDRLVKDRFYHPLDTKAIDDEQNSKVHLGVWSGLKRLLQL